MAQEDKEQKIIPVKVTENSLILRAEKCLPILITVVIVRVRAWHLLPSLHYFDFALLLAQNIKCFLLEI